MRAPSFWITCTLRCVSRYALVSVVIRFNSSAAPSPPSGREPAVRRVDDGLADGVPHDAVGHESLGHPADTLLVGREGCGEQLRVLAEGVGEFLGGLLATASFCTPRAALLDVLSAIF
jgi:hypothetical protein